MTITSQIARQLREVYFGVNWTWSNLKDQLKEINWELATKKLEHFNTIAALTQHLSYYMFVQCEVLKGHPLVGKDEESWKHPEIKSEEDWQAFLHKIWDKVEETASLIEEIPDSRLNELFADEKYGSIYRNLTGMIEHTHYHVGQIALLKKLL